MIPQDIIQRVVIAHDIVVKRAQLFTESAPGTQAHEIRWTAYQRAEDRFDSAMAALVDHASK